MQILGWGEIPDLRPGDYAFLMGRVSRGEKVQKSMSGQLADGRLGLVEVGLGDLPIRREFREEQKRLAWADRTDTQELLEAMKDPHCRAIGVWRLDRLIAGADQNTMIFELLAAFGVVLIERPDAGRARVTNPRNQGERMALTFQAEQAREEVIGTREKMSSSNPAKFRQGIHVTSSPYGTRRVPKLDENRMLVIGPRGKVEMCFERDPEQLAWVQQFFQWCAEGKTFDWVQDELNRLGVPTPRSAALWSKDRVREIVRSPFYKGEMTYGKSERVHYSGKSEIRAKPEEEWLTAPSPLGALIDPDLWEKANDEIARRWHVRGGGRGHRTNDPRVLDGLVYCDRCNGRMFPREQRQPKPGGRRARRSNAGGEWVGTGRFSYHCNGSNSIYSVCKGTHHSISEAKAFAALADYAAQAGSLVNGAVAHATVVRAKRDDSAELRLRKRLAKIAGKLEREKDLYVNDDRTKTEYERAKATLAGERAEVEAELADLARPRQERVYGPEAGEAAAALAALVPLLRDSRVDLDIRQREAAGLISRILVNQPSPILVEFKDAS